MGVSSDTQYTGESLALAMQTVPLVAGFAHAGDAVGSKPCTSYYPAPRMRSEGSSDCSWTRIYIYTLDILTVVSSYTQAVQYPPVLNA